MSNFLGDHERGQFCGLSLLVKEEELLNIEFIDNMAISLEEERQESLLLSIRSSIFL